MKRLIILVLSVCILSFANHYAIAQTQAGADLYGEDSANFFGSSVVLSADGTRMAVGAYGNSELAFRAGHVRVFEWTAGDWLQMGEDIDGELEWGLMGSAVSLSADGSRLAVGAPGTINGDLNGTVKVFDWNGQSWEQVGATFNGPALRDLWGTSLSLSSDGNRLAIGASHNDAGGNGAGQVRILEWEGTQWVQMGPPINGEAGGDRFGRFVSLAGNGHRVAVGAITNDDGGEDAGEVKVFTWNGQNWIQVGSDLEGYRAEDNFGWEVSLSQDGNRLAVTSRYDNKIQEYGAGYVRTFEWDNVAWRPMGEDFSSEDGGTLAGRGVAISSDGSRLVIGARNFSEGEYLPGYLSVYEWHDTSWDLVGMQLEVISEGEGIIDAVAISAEGNRIAFGSEKNGDLSGWAGKVAVFEFNPVSTNNTSNMEQLLIFPNPSSGWLRINGLEQGNLSIFDGFGRMVFRTNDFKQEINIGHLLTGIYTLQFDVEGRIVTKKLVKH